MGGLWVVATVVALVAGAPAALSHTPILNADGLVVGDQPADAKPAVAPPKPAQKDTTQAFDANGSGPVLPVASQAVSPGLLAESTKQSSKEGSKDRNQFLSIPYKPSKDMLIAVVSSPAHTNARAAIRRSYAMTARYLERVDVKFFVGQLPLDYADRDAADRAISGEEDMVRLTDFTEAYHNLSYKALDVFKYAADHNYRSVFKVDDDTYVRVPLALQFLDRHDQDPYLYAGEFVNGAKAMVADPNSKWYMKDQYPHDRLEDYANGPGILLGQAALTFFRENYDRLFRYRVDDAAVAIWLKDMPMHKTAMWVDAYSHVIHGDTVYVNPVNSEEMAGLHLGLTDSLQVCRDTCLCHGGPQPEGNCLNWDKFVSSGYRDLIPRLAFLQSSSATSVGRSHVTEE